MGILSPYFQTNDLRKTLPSRNIQLFSDLMIKAFISSYLNQGSGTGGALALVQDSAGTFTGSYDIPLSISSSDTEATISSQIATAVPAYFSLVGFTANEIDMLFTTPSTLAAAIAAAIPPAPASYQTIVSQTGTSAPAASGGLTPLSSYASGTTFIWARTSAGVYTLTASTAVFNTSGKTGVIFGGLNNLNGSAKAVVTSTTVITITTAIGSLLGLGVLGFTATPTDALFTATPITVQTLS